MEKTWFQLDVTKHSTKVAILLQQLWNLLPCDRVWCVDGILSVVVMIEASRTSPWRGFYLSLIHKWIKCADFCQDVVSYLGMKGHLFLFIELSIRLQAKLDAQKCWDCCGIAVWVELPGFKWLRCCKERRTQVSCWITWGFPRYHLVTQTAVVGQNISIADF